MGFMQVQILGKPKQKNLLDPKASTENEIQLDFWLSAKDMIENIRFEKNDWIVRLLLGLSSEEEPLQYWWRRRRKAFCLLPSHHHQ